MTQMNYSSFVRLIVYHRVFCDSLIDILKSTGFEMEVTESVVD